ncbi:tyrosine-type recombinase/integrase [Natrononativus amylolyticus]|uniref:tyrosine-type recombinase/integrase n=1 Tax=Natrononativus amylolyticus TaxID=2963434 RepID=UPI0020CEA229|nr:site-specific integrase [Natrononativus amylolyticus]
MTDLDSLRPEKAVEMYLTNREDELTKKSLQNNQSDLRVLKEWTTERGIDNMNDVDGRALVDFRNWRAEQVKLITLKHNLWTIKKFIRFCEKIDAVAEGTSEKVVIPKTDDSHEVNNSFIESGRATDILEFLGKFEYASLRHTVFFTLWHTGIRSSSLLALDLKDFHPEENKLCIRHRPEKGTALKNKERGERNVFIKDELVEVISDYVNENRATVLDDHGREPLFASTDTRVSRTTVQRMVYTATRPCHIGNECPHDENPETCEANSYNGASKCPSSLSPHPLRKGSITHTLNQDTPKDVISDRMDVSKEILDKHYNKQTKDEQMETRKQYLEGI